jgi:hypothetical protein
MANRGLELPLEMWKLSLLLSGEYYVVAVVVVQRPSPMSSMREVAHETNLEVVNYKQFYQHFTSSLIANFLMT